LSDFLNQQWGLVDSANFSWVIFCCEIYTQFRGRFDDKKYVSKRTKINQNINQKFAETDEIHITDV